ncbi:hypothetical protein HZA99_00140 [Candidatus Woesearchaeota archaeon]|nr:hypothetical protein [Candidatus Woesearchaeota archaeon]
MNEINQKTVEKMLIGILTVTIIIMAFNVFQVRGLEGTGVTGASVAGNTGREATAGTEETNAGEGEVVAMMEKIRPKGIPDIYGAELGVSFDAVSADTLQEAEETIKKLGRLDEQITLTGDDLQRYIAIGTMIGCEYCCGAEAIIFSNGKAACGCAHSYAMRGLAKYLIKNHGAEYTNDEILEEMGKWKTLFFPGKLAQKAIVLQDQGIELTYINLASNKYRGIESQTAATTAGQTMVGGC